MARLILANDIPEYNLTKGSAVQLVSYDEEVLITDDLIHKIRACGDAPEGAHGYSVRFRGRMGWIASREVASITV